MERVRRRKLSSILGWGLFWLSLILFGIAAISFQGICADIPNAILFLPSSEMRLSMGTLEPTGKGKLTAGVCCSMETPWGKADVIDQKYQELDTVPIIDGKKMDFTVPQALLSESLAEKLGKQPGDTLEMEDQTYRITGIFQELSSVQRLVPLAGQKLILSKSPGQEELLVNKILFWSENGSFLYVRDSSHELDSHYGQVFHGEFHNIALMKRTIEGISFFFLFLLLFPFLWKGIVSSWKLLVKAYTDRGKAVLYRVFFLAAGILLAVIICSAWSWLFGRMLPPRQYLPPEQIFDGYYYLDEIKSFYKNLQGECGNLFSIRILAELPVMQAFVYSLCVGSFWGSCYWVRKRRK